MLKTITSVANTVGSLEYKGLWNAATNTPTLVSSVGTQGDYYVVSVAGTTNLDGVTTWDEGDWAIFNGSVWQLFQDGQDGVFATLTVSNYAAFADNAKATFGTGAGDLQIYHDGSHSYVKDVGTGYLYVGGSAYALIQGGSYNCFAAANTGEATIYYQGNAKLSTTATGIDISGTATMDGLTVDGDINLTEPSPTITFTDTTDSSVHLVQSINTALNIQGQSAVRLSTAATKRFDIGAGGDISFYEDTGTTPKFFWDASAESLGINTTTPDALLEINKGSEGEYLRVGGDNASNARSLRFTSSTSSTGSNGALHTIKANSTGGEIAFANGNGNIMYLDSSGNAGIGTNAPASLVTGGNSPVLTIGGTDGGLVTGEKAGSLSFITSDSSYSNTYPDGITGEIVSVAESGTGAAYGLAFYTGTITSSNRGERLRISDIGNVGIGCTPSEKLHVATTGASGTQIAARFSSSTDAAGAKIERTGSYWRFASQSNLYLGADYDNNGGGTDSNIIFETDASERARLTGDGNFLVGTTELDVGYTDSGSGLVFGAAGWIQSARSSVDPNLYLNKLDNDGQILRFAKDGTTVGSIGVVNANNLTIGGEVASHAGMEFGTNQISPRSGGTSVDATVDLGYFSLRWKDLYLSGGVYLGGTGAANKLDDYEEGTWTPTIEGVTSGSITGFTVAAGNYTKIGNVVHAYCFLTGIDMTSSTVLGSFKIGNLPITGSSNRQTVVVSYCNMFSFAEEDVSISGYLAATGIILRKGSSILAVDQSDVGTNTSASIMVGITYHIV